MVPLRGVKCHFNGRAAPKWSKTQHEMNQSCVNDGKCPWLLKTNIAAGLGLRVTGDLKDWPLAWSRKMGEKLLAAGMLLLNLGWWDSGWRDRSSYTGLA